jgi:hypothetical protein
MSDIPKNKRSPSKLETIHQAYKIRTMITNELILTFGYSQKREEEHIARATSYIKDKDQREEQQTALKSMEYGFDVWIAQQERTVILNACRGIVEHLIKANTIYPTYQSEFEERRLELDRAMECCNLLQQELQYVAEVMPTDKNRYMNIVLETEHEYQMIRSMRKSDNRFLKNIKNG